MAKPFPERITACSRRFLGNSEKVLGAFQQICPPDVGNPRLFADANLQVECLVIFLFFQWEHFCRDIVAACSAGGTWDFSDKCRVKWYSVSEVKRQLDMLREKCQMDQQAMSRDSDKKIQTVLSVCESPVEKIRLTRNWFAHRSPNGLEKIKPLFPDVECYIGWEICCRKTSESRGVSQMEFWVRRLQTMASQIEKDI